MTETPNRTAGTRGGEAVNITGWLTFFLSVGCGLLMKGPAQPGRIDLPMIGFFFSLGVLGLGSVIYCVGALFSKEWRSKTMKSRFSPYLLGVAGWVVLILFLGFLAGLQ